MAVKAAIDHKYSKNVHFDPIQPGQTDGRYIFVGVVFAVGSFFGKKQIEKSDTLKSFTEDDQNKRVISIIIPTATCAILGGTIKAVVARTGTATFIGAVAGGAMGLIGSTFAQSKSLGAITTVLVLGATSMFLNE